MARGAGVSRSKKGSLARSSPPDLTWLAVTVPPSSTIEHCCIRVSGLMASKPPHMPQLGEQLIYTCRTSCVRIRKPLADVGAILSRLNTTPNIEAGPRSMGAFNKMACRTNLRSLGLIFHQGCKLFAGQTEGPRKAFTPRTIGGQPLYAQMLCRANAFLPLAAPKINSLRWHHHDVGIRHARRRK